MWSEVAISLLIFIESIESCASTVHIQWSSQEVECQASLMSEAILWHKGLTRQYQPTIRTELQ